MLYAFVNGSLILAMIASLIALIDGVIEYRNDPYLEWLKQYNERFTEDNEEE